MASGVSRPKFNIEIGLAYKKVKVVAYQDILQSKEVEVGKLHVQSLPFFLDEGKFMLTVENVKSQANEHSLVI